MNEEQAKDVRLILEMVVKDLRRLSDDLKCFSEMVIATKESEDVENIGH